MSALELKQFKKTNYCMERINNNKEYEPFSEEKYVTLIKSAHDKQYYGKKSSGDYNHKHTYRGQQSSKRFVQLCDIQDHLQLKNLKALLTNMEYEIQGLLDRYQDEAKQDMVIKKRLMLQNAGKRI